MRIAVLGGTRFIGRAIVEELASAGHQVLVVHRGVTEPVGLPPVAHLHCERAELRARRREIDAFAPDAAVDCRALSRADAENAMAALPRTVRWIVISSVDVYRAFGALNQGRATDPVPLDEESPVRPDRYPYRGLRPGFDDYDKLDVEEAFAAVGATVLRLPMVYGEHDYQRREEFILRRVRAGRTRIPFGSGQWLGCRGYVRDIARAIPLALASPRSAGQVFNVCEDRTFSMRQWAEMILDCAGSNAQLVRVADSLLPEDLEETGTLPQHILTTASKARSVLGWTPSEPLATLRTTVRWHLEHPPDAPDGDFSADDRALNSV